MVGKIEGMNDSCRLFEQESDKVIWVYNTDHVTRVDLDNDLTKAVQEKTAQVADFAKESFELIKEKTAQVTPEQADVEAETKAIVDDIVIDIKDISEEAAEAKIKRKPMRLFLVRKKR